MITMLVHDNRSAMSTSTILPSAFPVRVMMTATSRKLQESRAKADPPADVRHRVAHDFSRSFPKRPLTPSVAVTVRVIRAWVRLRRLHCHMCADAETFRCSSCAVFVGTNSTTPDLAGLLLVVLVRTSGCHHRRWRFSRGQPPGNEILWNKHAYNNSYECSHRFIRRKNVHEYFKIKKFKTTQMRMVSFSTEMNPGKKS